MDVAIRSNSLPVDAKTGLTLPLSKSLALPELERHRAMIAIELEVMAKKVDRFGWDRDRGTHAHDRLVTDWMDALQDYPLAEVKAACRACILASPNRMPNEGHVLEKIMDARRVAIAAMPRPRDEPRPPRVTPEAAAEIMAGAGYTPRRMEAAQ